MQVKSVVDKIKYNVRGQSAWLVQNQCPSGFRGWYTMWIRFLDGVRPETRGQLGGLLASQVVDPLDEEGQLWQAKGDIRSQLDQDLEHGP